MPPEAQALAEHACRALFARDRASSGLGMRLEAVGPGIATITMSVRADMLNGHATCHGGMIFTLADSAFGYACNSDNQATVALAAQISFIAPAREGDTLVATAREVARAGRTGVFDVEVRKDDGSLIAAFRGNSYRIGGSAVPPPAATGEAGSP